MLGIYTLPLRSPCTFPSSHGIEPYRLINVICTFLLKWSVYIIAIIYEAFYYIIILKTFILEQILVAVSRIALHNNSGYSYCRLIIIELFIAFWSPFSAPSLSITFYRKIGLQCTGKVNTQCYLQCSSKEVNVSIQHCIAIVIQNLWFGGMQYTIVYVTHLLNVKWFSLRMTECLNRFYETIETINLEKTDISDYQYGTLLAHNS